MQLRATQSPKIKLPRHSSAKGEKLARRLCRIFALLHQGDVVDKHQLAQEFQVDVRTIERDLGERLRGMVERNSEGTWQLAAPVRATIPARHLRDYAQLLGAEHLFPDGSQAYLLRQLQTPAAQRALRVHSAPGEDLRWQAAAFNQLEVAIQWHCHCLFLYKEKLRQVQPYRLILRSGIWYLAGLEGGKLKAFSVTLMQDLQVDDASSFVPDPAHQAVIDAKEDVWFSEGTTEVLLRVAPETAHYFTRRPLLPKQQQRVDTDGSLLVTAQISHPDQLLPLVRYWLPHVRIVQPVQWQHKLIEGLRNAVSRWDCTETPELTPVEPKG